MDLVFLDRELWISICGSDFGHFFFLNLVVARVLFDLSF